MIEVRLRTRFRCPIASCWAIMPPIEAPTTCAEQTSSVASHVDQRVGRCSRALAALEQTPQVGISRLGEVGGQPDVAIVETDHPQALIREQQAEPFVPAKHLCGQAHHEQDGWIFGIAERLIRDHDVAYRRLLCVFRHCHSSGLWCLRAFPTHPRPGGPPSYQGQAAS
jgi:hypothetical protein